MAERKGWNYAEIKDMAAKERYSFVDGDWVEAPFITSTGIRLIQTGNIGVGCFINKNKKFISEESFNFLRCKDVFAGDILICRLADPIGRSCIVPDLGGRALTSVDVCILRVDTTRYDRDFISHALNQDSFLAACQKKAGGSTRQRISRTNLGEIRIIVADKKEEQAKIAEILSTVDRAIAQTQSLIAKQQRIKTGLMQDLLTRGIDEQGNLRTEATHQFKDSPLGRIPVEWDVSPIGKYGSNERAFLKTGPFGSDLNTKHWTTEGVAVLTIGSLGTGNVLEEELLYISEPKAEKLKSFVVQNGDIIFSRVADIGRSIVISSCQDGWIISSNLMRISIDQQKARSKFLHNNIAYNEAIRKQLRATSNFGGRDVVNGAILSGLLFPWPSQEEQDLITNKIDALNDSCQKTLNSIEKLKTLKAALMQDLLTGKKRVTPLLNS